MIKSSVPCTKTREKSQNAPTIGESLSIAGKILTRVLLNRLVPTIAEDHLPETQRQQGHHWHGFRPQKARREMRGAKQRIVRSVCGPDQSVWHSEQKGTVDDHGVPWLSPKVPQYGYSNLRIPERSSKVEQRPLWILPHRQRRETVLCSGTDSVQHFFSVMLKQVTDDLDNDGAVYICSLLTAVCLTSGDYMPTQYHLSSGFVTSSSLTIQPSLPTLKEPCSI